MESKLTQAAVLLTFVKVFDDHSWVPVVMLLLTTAILGIVDLLFDQLFPRKED